MTITVSDIFIYPVKSLAAVSLSAARVLDTGLENDRQWMIVDSRNKFVTQRQIPKMATVQVNVNSNGLVLNHPDSGELVVPVVTRNEKPETFQIWKDTIEGYAEPDGATEWLTKTLGTFRGGPLRLVNFNNQFKRKVAEKYLEKQDASLKLADACPFLFTFEESLTKLNTELANIGQKYVMPMDRFRANIVFRGAAPFDEYGWSNIYHDKLDFGLVGACQRCPMTSIDQTKGVVATPGQPLQTLMEKFPVGEKNLPYFGQHARLLQGDEQQVKIGDNFQYHPANAL